MDSADLLRLLIRGARLVLLPFPLAFLACYGALVAAEHLFGDGPGDSSSGGPGFALLAATVVLQVIWGMSSLIILDAKHCTWRGYFLVGALSGGALSLGAGALLQAPEHGETFVHMFCSALIFLGVPVVLGYLLALPVKTFADGPLEPADSTSSRDEPT